MLTQTEDLLFRERYKAGIDSRKGDTTELSGYNDALDEIALKVTDVAGDVKKTLVNAFSSAEDALVSFVQTGKINFSSLVDSILADMTRMMFHQAISSLFGAGSGGAGLLGGLFSGLSGARADGGPVTMGNSYLVGERGPEIFTPGASGTITPNKSLQTAQQPPNISVVNVVDPSMVSAALSDPANDHVIINVIGRNKTAVNRVLGSR